MSLNYLETRFLLLGHSYRQILSLAMHTVIILLNVREQATEVARALLYCSENTVSQSLATPLFILKIGKRSGQNLSCLEAINEKSLSFQSFTTAKEYYCKVIFFLAKKHIKIL